MTLAYIGSPGCCCDGGGGGVLPAGCTACGGLIPSTLTLTSHDTTCGPCGAGVGGLPSGCNHGFTSCTLTYSPAEQTWLSPPIFQPGGSGGDHACFCVDSFVQYGMFCGNGINWLLKVRAVGPPPGAWFDLFTWSIGGSNTCHPFNLDLANNSVYFSTTSPCGPTSVTISE